MPKSVLCVYVCGRANFIWVNNSEVEYNDKNFLMLCIERCDILFMATYRPNYQDDPPQYALIHWRDWILVAYSCSAHKPRKSGEMAENIQFILSTGKMLRKSKPEGYRAANIIGPWYGEQWIDDPALNGTK